MAEALSYPDAINAHCQALAGLEVNDARNTIPYAGWWIKELLRIAFKYGVFDTERKWNKAREYADSISASTARLLKYTEAAWEKSSPDFGHFIYSMLATIPHFRPKITYAATGSTNGVRPTTAPDIPPPPYPSSDPGVPPDLLVSEPTPPPPVLIPPATRSRDPPATVDDVEAQVHPHTTPKSSSKAQVIRNQLSTTKRKIKTARVTAMARMKRWTPIQSVVCCLLVAFVLGVLGVTIWAAVTAKPRDPGQTTADSSTSYMGGTNWLMDPFSTGFKIDPLTWPI